MGQINIYWRPHRFRHGLLQPGSGGFQAKVLDTDQNPWVVPCGRRLELTLLSAVCRQLHRETALLPFRLNGWSFESAHVMERYVLRENRLSLPQRRAITTLYIDKELTKALEKRFSRLRVLVRPRGPKLAYQVLEGRNEGPRKGITPVAGNKFGWYLYP